nr:uncharacterized protein LOC127337707 [Lolium perenne]
MRVLFWNIRGFGRKGRRTLLKEYLRLHHIDVVLLQETIKQDFSDAELRSLEIGDKFFWDWLPASGQSGGMLIGVRDIMVSNRTLDIIGVYGPADHGRSREFLQELSVKIATSTRPLLLGGDFNLIRAAEDKNNNNLNWTLIDLFNDNIASWGLREIPRTGARFTWTNRQLNPVRSALDRVFVSPNFEAIFPLCLLAAETSLGSDHTPLVFDTGEGFPVRRNRFFFESSWLERPEFRSIVHTSWENLSSKVGGRDILDWWNFMSAGLRQHLRGWSHNLGRDSKETKAALLAQITQLDAQADAAGLDEEGWAARYHLEEQLLHLYRVEEEYWKQRGRTHWTLHGDANTAYFHAVANGRRRKCHISKLNTSQGPITDQRLIQQHTYDFYRELLGTTTTRGCGLAPDTWAGRQRVSQTENDRLMLTFSEEELENIVKDMKTNTAPGPAGLPIVSKAYVARLDPVANRIISANQTAFIKGRNILDGLLALIEIIHELKSKNLGGILLKLDFEKAYDRVNWDFLAEVLRAKGNKRGVRQGDPLSSLLFNFIGKALSAILSAARRAGHIHGVIPHLIPGGISHLQYADDTLILIQNSDEDIANLKFLLMCFEDMSGLKINYHKSEVILMGQQRQEQTRITNKLNCKLGAFPFIYLGLPISDRKLTLEQWFFLVRKLAIKVEPWLRKLLSSGGRLILTYACLDNLPMYAMGLFLLHDGIHARFDSHRSKFYWEGGPET